MQLECLDSIDASLGPHCNPKDWISPRDTRCNDTLSRDTPRVICISLKLIRNFEYKKKKKKRIEKERGKITNRDIETALVLFVVEKKRFRTQYSHTNWLQQFAFLRVQIKFESLHHLFVYEINVSPMSWNVKYCWLVDSFQGRYTKGSRFTRRLTPRCHWQFLFHRERWSRRATVVGQDVEQVASNCLPGSGQVSSGWIEEGIEDHAGYRYLRIRIVTSLRATGSLPPKRATLDMNQFRLAFN